LRTLVAAIALVSAPAYAESGVAAAVNGFLGLRASSLQRVDLDAGPDQRLTARISIAGEVRTLELAAHSVRAESYEVRAQQADGSWITVEPQPVRTLRGRVAGVAGSAVAGARLDDGLYATIRLPDGRTYWMEPVGGRVAAAGPGLYAVYDQADVLASGRSCAVDAAVEGLAAGGGGPESQGACELELACDADVEFYEDYNSSVPDVEDRINLILNTVNLQYEQEVDITHLITTILVRTAEPDPYISTDAATLLNEFRNHWNLNHTDIPRDAAQLFTGRDLDSTIVGIAYVGTTCGALGYSLVQSDFDENFGFVTDLSAHELGHTWGAPHCACTSPPYTMNSNILGSNTFNPSITRSLIAAFRDMQTCIECQPTLVFSYPQGFPDLLDFMGGTTVQVLVEPGLATPAPDTGTLHLIVNDGPLNSLPMTEIEPGLYEAIFPAFGCADVVEYFFSAETTESQLVKSPLTAPVETYEAMSGDFQVTRFLDQFQTQQQWSVDDVGLTDGSWERREPISVVQCDRGNPDGDGDGSGRCYLTDNDHATCDSDVDGDSTTLTSPVMDASGAGTAIISYYRWYDNTGSGIGPNPFEDILEVQVSDDGGASWATLETVGPTGDEVTGRWISRSLRITDAGISQTDQFRIRYVAQDLGGESIVEAAVDGVGLRMVVCCPWDLDVDGEVGIVDFLDLLAQWGAMPAGPPDFDGDGTVGITDFLALLGNWGTCP
jgi:hypothetical protein